MINYNFSFTRTPYLFFGAGQFNGITDHIKRYGNTVLIITGAHSFQNSGNMGTLIDNLKIKSVQIYHMSVAEEPSPDLIDKTVSQYKNSKIDVVLSIGGGSVIDTGKAVSAMLTQDCSVVDFLEGVGKGISHNGKKVPFIAVPTTAGTGSEATKNAVLSQIGSKGYKRSIRHDNFVPEIAVIDPELHLNCPSDITASSGMDAFSQLLESYVSTKASPITDALALEGIKYIKENLIISYEDGNNIKARAGMAYAAYLSGLTLVNAGLGVVHGLASIIGGLFPVPHGVICGTLVGSAMKRTIEKLKKEDPKVLEKFTLAGLILSKNQDPDTTSSCDHLITIISEWIDELKIPGLSKYGIEKSHIKKIAEKAGNKNNPIALSEHEIETVLLERL